MTKNNKIVLGAISALALAGAVLTVSHYTLAADAANANGQGFGIGRHKMLTESERTAMETEREQFRAKVEAAISANDYEAWKTAVGADSEIAKIISSDKFAKYVEAHNLRQQADEIMSDLGLKGPEDGRGFGPGMGRGGMRLGAQSEAK